MTMNVGVIGVGMIGQDHIRRLTTVLAGANVVAVSDVNLPQAEKVASRLGSAKVHATGEGLIVAKEVDAVILSSWGATHAAYVLAAIKAGKPVFCEKPLAEAEKDCSAIIDAEAAFGRRLAQLSLARERNCGGRNAGTRTEADKNSLPVFRQRLGGRSADQERELEVDDRIR